MVSFSQCLYGQSVAAFCGKGKNKNTASSDRRRGGAPDLYGSGAHNADALLDVISVLDLIDHGNGIVCIGDNGLSAVIEDKLLAALQVLPGPLSVRLEIPGGAYGSPLHIVSLPELSEGLCHCRSKGLEGIREVLSLGDGCPMMRYARQHGRIFISGTTGYLVGIRRMDDVREYCFRIRACVVPGDTF